MSERAHQVRLWRFRHVEQQDEGERVLACNDGTVEVGRYRGSRLERSA